ncbi:ABC transporter permease [Limnoglobus roseus]|uniref:Peptide ABC transporter permease n=1 Tax=Limnoglobus roseus TaxID=2598579 RepID=A0A5C1AKB2_9BACT|nr:ABC transporter permease [Limnoglobus roseus]QEL18446.1 peptide ABC transporter permease [Limnoglobus roseus]
MSYSLTTIWFERNRFLPAILAVAFSAVLIAVQGGLVIGLLAMMSLPIDKSRADVWVGYPGVRSVDLGRPLPDRWVTRVVEQPEVERAELAMIGFSLWTRVSSTQSPATPEVCTVVGSTLGPDSLAAVEGLRQQPDLMARLSEPFTVAVDESELGRLNITGVGQDADILGKRVTVVGLVHGYKSLGGPYVFCSNENARVLLKYFPGEATYIVAKCGTPEDAKRMTLRMKGYSQLTAFTADDFSWRSRMHWLFTTKAGVTVGFTALLGLLVGAVVTSQTLYAATAASLREYSTLRAMGIPRWRLQLSVLEQSFWVGLFGVMVAAPVTFVIAQAANYMGTQVMLHPLVIGIAILITMVMAIGSGLAALRSFQNVDPAHNLR